MKFAPLSTPWNRRFQTMGASFYIFSFVFCGPTMAFTFIYLWFTSYWPLCAIYLVYLYTDRKTPEQGGRSWFWVRNWKIWTGLRDYFPATVRKTTDLDPRRNYMLVCYPHGVLCPGTFITITAACSHLYRLFPGFDAYLTMLPFWFRIPFHRDYLMCGSLVSSSKKSITHLVNKKAGGNLVAVLPGGAPESLDARPGDVKIIVRKRMGFIKLALTNGVPIVPCFSFGDHEVWDQTENPVGSRLRRFQEAAMKYFDVAFPLFSARGIFQYNVGLLPRRRPLTFVVGEPMEIEKNPNPTGEELEELREKFIERLQALFDEHRQTYLGEDVKLIIT